MEMSLPLTFKPLFDSTISTPAAKHKAVREHILITLTVIQICGKFTKFFLVPKQENKKKLNMQQIFKSIRYSQFVNICSLIARLF